MQVIWIKVDHMQFFMIKYKSFFVVGLLIHEEKPEDATSVQPPLSALQQKEKKQKGPKIRLLGAPLHFQNSKLLFLPES